LLNEAVPGTVRAGLIVYPDDPTGAAPPAHLTRADEVIE
jgi:hypothetical protein